MKEFNINEVTAQFISQNIASFFKSTKSVLKLATEEAHLRLRRTYSDYLHCVLDKYSKAKSFFIRSESAFLYEFYIPLSVKYQTKTINNPILKDVISLSPRLILIGSGGSGKSMFLRHLFLNSITSGLRVPIFIELRQFNDIEVDLLDLIHKTLESYKFDFDLDYTRKALKNGHFAIFLDGFDEVIHAKRQIVSKYIFDFAKSYDKNYIIMSSRPDTELEGWPGFSLLKLQPLTAEQAGELIMILPYDDELKQKFVYDLKSVLFEKHKTFLSNPLLLSIMLLTYGQSANIPEKLNVFYNQAYEALFERHDALKGGYQRKRLTSLDIQDFARVFSAFCIQTYDKRKFEINHIEALEYLEKAQKITRIDYNKADYLKDAMQAVCLLIEEGLTIVFSHRSFQEYFTARFIAEANPSMQARLIQKYSSNVQKDDVMALLYEIRPDLVEQYYILPTLGRLFKDIGYKNSISLSQYVKYLKLTYTSFKFRGCDILGERGISNYSDQVLGSISFTLSKCGHLVGWSGFENVETYEANINYLCNKYNPEGTDRVLYMTKDLTTNHRFVKDLATRGAYFSLDTLKLLIKILEGLKSKALLAENSLEDILRDSEL